MKRLIAGLSLLIFILPQGAWADPSPGIRWLQNNPVSLFDLGILKIQRYLENLEINYFDFDKKTFTPTPKIQLGKRIGTRQAMYLYQSNKLVIEIVTLSDEKTGSKEDQCKNSVNVLRKSILWSHAGKEIRDHGYGKEASRETLKSFFGHEGYSFKSRPNTLEKSLQILHIYGQGNWILLWI